LVVAAALAAALAGCGDVRREAAPDVGAFLDAAQRDDRMAFEVHIDRPAVRADLKGQLMDLPEVRILQEQLGDQVGDVAVDRMISPRSFRDLRASAEALPPHGDLKAIRARLKVLAPDRVCLRGIADKDGCLLTFARQGQAWKLVALQAPGLKLRALGDLGGSSARTGLATGSAGAAEAMD
jgi:hypothetical protein